MRGGGGERRGQVGSREYGGLKGGWGGGEEKHKEAQIFLHKKERGGGRKPGITSVAIILITGIMQRLINRLGFITCRMIAIRIIEIPEITSFTQIMILPINWPSIINQHQD